MRPCIPESGHIRPHLSHLLFIVYNQDHFLFPRASLIPPHLIITISLSHHRHHHFLDSPNIKPSSVSSLQLKTQNTTSLHYYPYLGAPLSAAGTLSNPKSTCPTKTTPSSNQALSSTPSLNHKPNPLKHTPLMTPHNPPTSSRAHTTPL